MNTVKTYKSSERDRQRARDWYTNNIIRVRERYARNRDHELERMRLYREANRSQMRGYYHRVKEQVFEHYGYRCECCGETTSEFLTIDHIEGGGSKHKKKIGSRLYWWLVENNFPDGFRVLCFNCNCSRGSHGYCPHEKSGT